jgi:hypothetical protein
MKNLKTTYSQNLQDYARTVALKNYHKTSDYNNISTLYVSNIGVLIEDCIRIFDSLKLFK